MIERAHRSKSKNNFQGPRFIYASIDDWRNSEYIKEIFANRNSTLKNVYCEQKYGPLTSWRRSQAMKKRRELLDNKLIEKGYVNFPAILMVLKPGNKIYELEMDYSKIEHSNGLFQIEHSNERKTLNEPL